MLSSLKSKVAKNNPLAKKVKLFTNEQVAEHNSERSLWIIINRKVYDVTKFFRQHPGGPDVMKAVAGSDGTDAFLAGCASTSGLPKRLMKEFFIGRIRPPTPEEAEAIQAKIDAAEKLAKKLKDDEEEQVLLYGQEYVDNLKVEAEKARVLAAAKALKVEAEAKEMERLVSKASAGGMERLNSLGTASDGALSAADLGAEVADAGKGPGKYASEYQGTKESGIVTDKFEELQLEPHMVQQVQAAWSAYNSAAGSREAAAEAIYGAFFDAAPSLQSLFVTPRAVQSSRFYGGIQRFVENLGHPAMLKTEVETLGFGHLQTDVTVSRACLFRDALLDMFEVECGDRFTSGAGDGWRKLLNYVAGGLIYVRMNYSERLRVLSTSWKYVTQGETVDEDGDAKKGLGEGESDDEEEEKDKEEKKKKDAGPAKEEKKGWKLFGGGKDEEGGGGETGAGEGGQTMKSKNMGSNVPTDFRGMFMFNAAVMGFGQSTWMTEVLDCFDGIVSSVSNMSRLGQECDVLSLRINKHTTKEVNLSEFKACMLASLRSLLAKAWGSTHEVAWNWLWENVERLIKQQLFPMGNLTAREVALRKLYDSLTDDSRYALRADVFERFFASTPAGETFFKQSSTYLHIIADKMLEMTVDMYKEPANMVDSISALGLRHVGYGIPTELFSPFVTAAVEVVSDAAPDKDAVESFRWSLGLIAKILVRVIIEGSTIVMKAINSNSRRELVKAIAVAPRGERATWMLKVQVGTQAISPLSWAIESGSVDAAKAIIDDLLTIRADRDRYYYGYNDLFSRHSDIFKRLCEEAPQLLNPLLDGMLWRSTHAEGGMRRVNYYVKHILMAENGDFSKTLEWTAKLNDPRLVCHPVLAFLSDLVWSELASRRFLFGKSWFLFTLLLFILSQSVFEHLNAEKGPTDRMLIFACRCGIYGGSMAQLMYHQAGKTYASVRARNFMKVMGVRVPRYLENWQDLIGLCLMLVLFCLLSFEPILHCWNHQRGDAFTEDCPEAKHLKFTYSIFCMLAMFCYYGLLTDLTVFSTRVSAFVFVCGRMLPELALFLLSLSMVILTFSCSISALRHSSDDFHALHVGAIALLRTTLRMYGGERFEEFGKEPIVLTAVFVFQISAVVFLFNMLIAQLTCSYESIYADMAGYARLKRVKIIVETMQSVPIWRWEKFLHTLKLDQKLEFNEGDVGLKGGVQVLEPVGANPTNFDSIRRFGGSTSATMKWPADDMAASDDSDRFGKMERTVKKSIEKIQSSSSKKGTGGGTQSGSGTGGGTLTGSKGGTETEENDQSGSQESEYSGGEE